MIILGTGNMDVKGIRTQADLYCLFKKITERRPSFDGVTYTRTELECRVGQSRKRADLVLLAEKQKMEEKPFLVVETKRSKHEEKETNYDQIVVVPGIGQITVREGIARGLWDEMNYKYHAGALRQANEYAQVLNAPFYAVCYADTLFIKSFVKQHGLFYSPIDLTEEFGLKLLKELAQLYNKISPRI